MKKKIAWRIFVGIAYLAVSVGIISVGSSRFETVILAVFVQMYSAMLYNFSLIAVTAEVNNLAGFVRFRVLAAAQGIAGDDAGEYLDQENLLKETIKKSNPLIWITRISHSVVSLYALYKIIAEL